MLKKIISVVLAALLCAPLTANAATIYYGFDGYGGTTETVNEYFFDESNAVLVENKEAFSGFDYEEIYAGSYLLLPLMVRVNGGTPTAVTDKLMKSDNVTFSYKILRGINFVEELSIVDGKKLKMNGVAAGTYIKIPFVNDYSLATRATITMEFVLSVNNITYQYTQTTLNCRIGPYITDVRSNTVYGAKIPMLFKVDKKYSGEATFDFGNEIKFTAKVNKNDTFFLNLSREANPDVAAMYPDAYLEFYNFLGNKDSFPRGGHLEIPVNVANLSKKDEPASLYVYRIDGKTLTALASGVVSFNAKTGKLKLNSKLLGSYVLSNQPLSRTVTSSTSDSNILKSGYAS